MSNNWRYSSLTQRERLKMISGGNSDVYNAEKEKNKQLKNERASLGLDTSNVDLWDSAIDKAYFKATDPRRVTDKGQPRFMSYGTSMLVNEFNKQLKKLKSNAEKSSYDARKNAFDSTNALKEWLANNGYSQNGSYAQKEFANITNTLSKTLKQINKDYQEGVKLASQKLRSQIN